MTTPNQDILVNFVDEATGATFATAPIPLENLPDTFDSGTTLEIGDMNWSVVQAEPDAKAEFTKSGTLTLILRQIEMVGTDEISFSQLDVTERFDDHLNLDAEDWIPTIPLNSEVPDPESSGLPSPDAAPEEVYEFALKLSALREQIPIPNDGVYCPICHIANIDLEKLKTPCPQCERPLLKFGWD